MAKADSDSFQALLEQTFQSYLSNDDNVHDQILDMVRNECHKDMLEKVAQLKKALHDRTGCIIVGPVNSGKSCLWKQLKISMNKCNLHVTTFEVNPKALPRNHIFGKLDTDTGEWKDGVITALIRQALLNEAKEQYTWIICDGDIDPEWIESLNSVLDDNLMLTLPTGERLHLSPNINFIFETRDLSFASPATITRNAIICTNQMDSFHPNLVEADMKTLLCWAESHDHFILMGHAGSGRDYMIDEVFSRQKGKDVQAIYCHDNTSPQDVVAIVKEFCTLSSALHGAIYRPTHSKKMVFVLKNLECVRFDRYGSSELLAFFNHWFDYGGYYDEDAKFYYIEDIQVVFIATEDFSKQNSHVFQRLAKNMKVGVKKLPEIQDIITMTSTFLSQSWLTTTRSVMNEIENKKLAGLMVDLINAAREGCHQTIPLYILYKWIDNLVKYANYTEMKNSCIAYEARRAIENLTFDSLEKQDVSAFSRNICSQFDLDSDSPYCFFSPSTPSEFTLIPTSEANMYINKFLDSCTNDTSIHLLEEVMQSLSDIQHALYTGSKNVLMLGRIGSGKKTLIKLACKMNDIDYVTITTTANWEQSKFRSQLQHFLIKAGVENERICLHIEEHILTDTTMISMLCQVLSGEESCLNNFFDAKGLKDCLSHLHNTEVTMGRDIKRSKKLFLSNIKTNLRISMSMVLPLNKAAKLFEKHPLLKRYTEIVYVRDWKESSLRTYVEKRCKNQLDKIDASPEIVLDTILKVHRSTEAKLGTSLLDLMEFVNAWSDLFDCQNEKIESEMSTLHLGLTRLDDSNSKVNELKLESNQVEQNVIKAQSAADEAMKHITDEMANAQMKIKETEELKAKMASQSHECKTRKESIESEIIAIRPVLETSKQGKLS